MTIAEKKTGRSDPRTNLFIVATLYTGEKHEAVRLRDLSPRGALLEGNRLPAAGSEVRLCRADLETRGQIVWHRAGRAGMQFASTICVPDWLPAGKTKAAQQRVDQIVQQTKKALGPGNPTTRSQPAPTFSNPNLQEAQHLMVAIKALSDDLANEPQVVERHATNLQTLDLAVQFLERLVTDPLRTL